MQMCQSWHTFVNDLFIVNKGGNYNVVFLLFSIDLQIELQFFMNSTFIFATRLQPIQGRLISILKVKVDLYILCQIDFMMK